MPNHSEEIYREIINTPLGRKSSIADLGSLEVIEGLSYFFPRAELDQIKSNSWILEIGSGIGTITRLLLKNYRSDIVCYEVNDFCLRTLRQLKSNLNRTLKSRMSICSNLDFLNGKGQNELEFKRNYDVTNLFAIFCDGPISRRDLKAAIINSVNLHIVFVQGWRLFQRWEIARLINSTKKRQSYVEIRHKGSVTCAIFFVTNQQGVRFSSIRAHIDLMVISMQLLPKMIKNMLLSKGESIKVGSFSEDNAKRRI